MAAFARQCVLAAALLGCVASSAGSAPGNEAAHALPPADVGERVMRHRMAGIALAGFDPVAYFDRARPVSGKAEHEVRHDGAAWRFASEANRAAFLASPEVYMPAFGGHDPLAVAAGRAVLGEPRHFAIREQRLFIFSAAASRDSFLASEDMLRAADERWPSVERQLAR